MDHVCRLPGISLERYMVLRLDKSILPTEENIRDTIKSKNSHILHVMLRMNDVDIKFDYDKDLIEGDDSYILYLLQSYGYMFKAYHLLDGKRGKYISQYFIHCYPLNNLQIELVMRLACLYGELDMVACFLPKVSNEYIDELYSLTKNKEIRKLLKPNKCFIC